MEYGWWWIVWVYLEGSASKSNSNIIIKLITKYGKTYEF